MALVLASRRLKRRHFAEETRDLAVATTLHQWLTNGGSRCTLTRGRITRIAHPAPVEVASMREDELASSIPPAQVRLSAQPP
jgi:hypothetical protein